MITYAEADCAGCRQPIPASQARFISWLDNNNTYHFGCYGKRNDNDN